jgi:hypothetical protein
MLCMSLVVSGTEQKNSKVTRERYFSSMDIVKDN